MTKALSDTCNNQQELNVILHKTELFTLDKDSDNVNS